MQSWTIANPQSYGVSRASASDRYERYRDWRLRWSAIILEQNLEEIVLVHLKARNRLFPSLVGPISLETRLTAGSIEFLIAMLS